MTLQQPQSEQLQMQILYSPQVVAEFMPVQSEIDPSGQWYQDDGFAQMTPPPQFPIEQHACPQTPRGVLDAHEEQLGDRRMGIVAPDWMADLSNIKSEESEAMHVSEIIMSKYLNLDGYDVQYDGAS
jgi:hypothetical protein